VLSGTITMPKKPTVIPRFKSEAEEADWWDAHPEVATEIMKRALKAGKSRRPVSPQGGNHAITRARFENRPATRGSEELALPDVHQNASPRSARKGAPFCLIRLPPSALRKSDPEALG